MHAFTLSLWENFRRGLIYLEQFILEQIWDIQMKK